MENFEDLVGAQTGNTAVVLIPGPTLAEYDDSKLPAEFVRIASEEAAAKSLRTRYVVVGNPDRVDFLHGQIDQEACFVVGGHGALEVLGKKWVNRIYMANMGRRGEAGDILGAYGPEIAALDLACVLGCRRVFVFGLDLYRLRDKSSFMDVPVMSMEERTPPSDADAVYVMYSIDEGTHPVWKTYRHRIMDEGLCAAKAMGRWSTMEAWCVGSPRSQQGTIPKLAIDQLAAKIAEAPAELAKVPREKGSTPDSGPVLPPPARASQRPPPPAPAGREQLHYPQKRAPRQRKAQVQQEQARTTQALVQEEPRHRKHSIDPELIKKAEAMIPYDARGGMGKSKMEVMPTGLGNNGLLTSLSMPSLTEEKFGRARRAEDEDYVPKAERPKAERQMAEVSEYLDEYKKRDNSTRSPGNQKETPVDKLSLDIPAIKTQTGYDWRTAGSPVDKDEEPGVFGEDEGSESEA